METQDISKNLGNGDILIYQSEDGRTHIDVRMEQETVWLTQQQLCELYQTSKSNVSEHIKHIFEDGELDENVVVRKFRTTTQHGAITGKTQSHEVTFYNLDMIISLGYRIRSVIATRFRQWATKRLNEYIVKGFTMDDERVAVEVVGFVVGSWTWFIPSGEDEGVTVLTAKTTHEHVVRPSSAVAGRRVGCVVALKFIVAPLETTGVGVE